MTPGVIRRQDLMQYYTAGVSVLHCCIVHCAPSCNVLYLCATLHLAVLYSTFVEYIAQPPPLQELYILCRYICRYILGSYCLLSDKFLFCPTYTQTVCPSNFLP
jgi:hypothetical protein